MATAYQNPTEAAAGLGAAFNPGGNSLTPEQISAINTAASLVPTTIPATSLNQNQTAATIPTPKTTDYGSALASGNAILGSNASSLTGSSTTSTDPLDLLNKYLAGSTPPPSAADQYATDYANAGIDAKTQTANADAAAVKAAQAKLAATTAQIQGLTAEATGQKLLQENTFGTTGNTVGQQAQIDRNYAVKAIPLQIQALAQQAEVAGAQGNAQLSQAILTQAQQHLDTVFQIHQQDATNQYNFLKSLRDSVFQYATTQQQNQLAAQQKASDQAFTTQQNNLNYAQDLAKTALTNGQSGIASQILALDPTSPTYRNDVATLAGNITSANVGGGSVYAPPVSTVQTSGGATAVNQYTLKAGDDPYVIAQQNGTDMATLQKLNPNITGTQWNNLPVGAVINLPNSNDAWLNGKTQGQIQTYNALPPADKASVKQLVTGDALLSDLVKSRGIQGTAAIQKLINEATAIDPSFSVNVNKQRYTYKTQFNNPNGKEQSQIYSINTALGHLAEFNAAAQKLGNAVLLPYNKLVNYLKENSGNPDVSNLNTVITALAGELASVYKNGTAPTDQETEQWRNTILSSFSQNQSAGVAATTANLISNKMLSLNNAYKNIMGSYPDAPIINPDVIQQLTDSGVNISAITDRLKAQGYSVPTTLSPAGVHSTLSQYGLGSADSILGQYGL